MTDETDLEDHSHIPRPASIVTVKEFRKSQEASSSSQDLESDGSSVDSFDDESNNTRASVSCSSSSRILLPPLVSDDADSAEQLRKGVEQQRVEDVKFLEDKNDLCNLLNFQNYPGCHTIKSPVVGSRAAELLIVKKAMKFEAVLEKLQEAIYKDYFIYLIPIEKKDEADEIARELFLNYISKYTIYGCTERNIVEWCYSGMPGCTSNKVHIYDVENEWNTWRVHALVEARHGNHNEKYYRYLPPHIVAYHELMHVEETPHKAGEITGKENGNELLTVIKTIILLDIVYKKIYGVEEASEINYNQFIITNGTKISLGRFANFYREQEKKLGNCT